VFMRIQSIGTVTYAYREDTHTCTCVQEGLDKGNTIDESKARPKSRQKGSDGRNLK